MTYRGRVQNGVMMIEGSVSPPERARIEVSLVKQDENFPTLP